jgi:hypothetical protein
MAAPGIAAADRLAPSGAADARCPRCGGGFHCGVHDATPCACATLQLSASLRAALAARYCGCLCLACLRALAQAEADGAPADAVVAGARGRTPGA